MSSPDDLTVPAADWVEVTTAGADIDVQAMTALGGPGTIVVHDQCARLDTLPSGSGGIMRTLTDVNADSPLAAQVLKIGASTTVGVRIWIFKS